jgi:hypothetical protein
MAFVWVDELQPSLQGVLWQEGYDPEKNDYAAGFAITIDSQGLFHASVGQGGGNWAFALSSADRVGRLAWHHGLGYEEVFPISQRPPSGLNRVY